MNKNFKTRAARAMIVLFAALVVGGLVCFFLADSGVINANAFQLTFAVLAIGAGLIFTVYGAIAKGGYEFAVGGVCFDAGLIVALIGAVKWCGIVIIAVSVLVLLLFALLYMKAEYLHVERTNEKSEEDKEEK